VLQEQQQLHASCSRRKHNPSSDCVGVRHAGGDSIQWESPPPNIGGLDTNSNTSNLISSTFADTQAACCGHGHSDNPHLPTALWPGTYPYSRNLQCLGDCCCNGRGNAFKDHGKAATVLQGLGLVDDTHGFRGNLSLRPKSPWGKNSSRQHVQDPGQACEGCCNSSQDVAIYNRSAGG
jgi:hypothetical protein